MSKKNLLESGILKGMLDIHSHILSGVDDGAQDLESSRKICDVYREVGIERAFCTPHIIASLPQNNVKSLEESFGRFKQHDLGIEFRLAAEYMIDGRFVEATSGPEMLSYDGKYVLIETPRRGLFADIKDLLFGVIEKGYMPVLAHPERYIYYTPEEITAIKEKGILFQLNIPSLADYYGEHIGQRARYFFDNGMYDLVGTDFHGPEQLKFISPLSLDAKGMRILERLVENNESLWR